ncbi:MAG: hypothetical protein ACREPT_10680, partial [Rudaea sp.]
ISGSLSTLVGLPLQTVDLSNNALSNSIPPLTGFTSLSKFSVGDNQLTGNIPSLTGLTALQIFDVDTNQLIGGIPAFVGLTNLASFKVEHNQLTGAIPNSCPKSQGSSNCKILKSTIISLPATSHNWMDSPS